MVSRAKSGTELIRLAWPDVGAAEAEAVAEVLESGQLTMGPRVEEFERGLAAACGTEHALVVSSGTAALHVAVLALGIGPGDEVLVPAYTFPATANVVAFVGAKPVLVDVDPETMNLDPAKIEVGPRTKAIIAVDLFGRPMRVEQLPDGVSVLEDAAGALGGKRQGRPCGSLGALACLSFHPRKIVTTGEGGAVTTDDAGLADAIRRIRHHGIEPHGVFQIAHAGLNYRLSDILCAVGIPQLARLDELLEARTRIAEGYTERLRDIVETPSADAGDVHGWQAYVIQVDGAADKIAALREQGIEAQVGTYALHRLTAYRDQGEFPGASRVFDRAVALPFHTRLSDGDIDRVADALTRLVSKQ
ncbi:MAG: DegT/DnrJ/EryC1/StrS family aminotransferase [Actinobacteria bacterium]|nr:MAG: DegT/DnrJ/EryC1/StrS family aminotransferase [Actinomycetota bacterium]